MGRKARGPWYWSQRDLWCATVNGQRIPLVKGEGSRKEAEIAWHRIMGESPVLARSAIPLTQLVNLFLDQAKARVAPSTYVFYKNLFASLAEAHGKIDAATMKPYHIDQWIAMHEWKPNTRRGAITVTKILFRWAKRRGYLDDDPMADLEKPRRTRREVIPSPQMALLILETVPKPPFKDFLLAIWGTGCRPGEAAKVEGKDIDPKTGTWTIDGKTTRRTGRMRKVYPPPSIAELCRVKSEENPTGPIFRNTQGDPWTRDAYAAQMRRIRKSLYMGREVVCYSFRHLFATDAEEKGVAPATVAALLGHSSVAQLWTYSKIHTRDEHLRSAVDRVRGASRDDPPSALGTGDEEQPPASS